MLDVDEHGLAVGRKADARDLALLGADKEAADLLASDGMLIKRPLLVKDGKVIQVGYRKPYADLDL